MRLHPATLSDDLRVQATATRPYSIQHRTKEYVLEQRSTGHMTMESTVLTTQSTTQKPVARRSDGADFRKYIQVATCKQYLITMGCHLPRCSINSKLMTFIRCYVPKRQNYKSQRIRGRSERPCLSPVTELGEFMHPNPAAMRNVGLDSGFQRQNCQQETQLESH